MGGVIYMKKYLLEEVKTLNEGKFYGTPKYLSVPVHQIIKLITK